jgi:hypothetical protein
MEHPPREPHRPGGGWDLPFLRQAEGTWKICPEQVPSIPGPQDGTSVPQRFAVARSPPAVPAIHCSRCSRPGHLTRQLPPLFPSFTLIPPRPEELLSCPAPHPLCGDPIVPGKSKLENPQNTTAAARLSRDSRAASGTAWTVLGSWPRNIQLSDY